MSVQRSGLNLNSGEFYGEYRYINYVKSAQRPLCNMVNGLGYLSLTDDAYPTETTTGVSFIMYLARVPGSSVTYVVKWKGQGTYQHTSFGTTTPSGRTFGGFTWAPAAQNTAVINGRMTFTVPDGGTYASAITLKGNGTPGATNQLTDFVICKLTDEDAFDSGQIFRPEFLNYIASYKPAWIRFMDAQSTNTSALANWEDRPRASAMTMHAQRWSRTKFVSGTANPGEIATTSANIYSANAYPGMPATYQHGELVQGHFNTTSSSTTPTLNVGGRGAKVITANTAPLSTGGTNYQTQIFAAGSAPSGHTTGPYSFTFDAYYDQWMMTEGPCSFGQPLEDLVALCNITQVGGWFNIPIYGTDAFITSFANYLVANWTSPGPVMIEWGNEIWNYAINWTSRVDKWGVTAVAGSPPQGIVSESAYYGQRVRQISNIMRPIFAAAGKAALLKIVIADQGAKGNVFSNLQTQFENYRMQNPSYPAVSGANAPYLFADYISHQMYYCPSSVLGGTSASGPGSTDGDWAACTQNATLKTHIDAWVANSSYTAGFDFLRDAWLNDSSVQGYIFAAGGRFDNWNTLAKQYGMQVAMYEYNHQILEPSSTWTAANAPWNSASYGDRSGKISAFLCGFYKSQQFKDLTLSLLTGMYRPNMLGPSLYGMAISAPWLTFPCADELTGSPNIGGDSSFPPYKNWDANVAWNNKTTRSMVIKN